MKSTENSSTHASMMMADIQILKDMATEDDLFPFWIRGQIIRNVAIIPPDLTQESYLCEN